MKTTIINQGKLVSEKNKQDYQVLNMCDFCANEIATCMASPIFSQSLDLGSNKIKPENAVLACDRYTNPVTALKKQFH